MKRCAVHNDSEWGITGGLGCIPGCGPTKGTADPRCHNWCPKEAVPHKKYGYWCAEHTASVEAEQAERAKSQPRLWTWRCKCGEALVASVKNGKERTLRAAITRVTDRHNLTCPAEWARLQECRRLRES